VIALDERGQEVSEDIVPNSNFVVSGSLLLNSAPIRKKEGIRMISVRVFDSDGKRLRSELRYFSREGVQVEALHRRPDGTIIEPAEAT